MTIGEEVFILKHRIFQGLMSTAAGTEERPPGPRKGRQFHLPATGRLPPVAAAPPCSSHAQVGIAQHSRIHERRMSLADQHVHANLWHKHAQGRYEEETACRCPYVDMDHPKSSPFPRESCAKSIGLKCDWRHCFQIIAWSSHR